MNQRQKKTMIAALVALLGITLILSVVWMTGKERRFNKYHNERHDFAIGYPSLWELQENTGGAAVLFLSPKENPLDFFRESVNVVVQDLTASPTTFPAYTKVAIEQMEMVFGENFVLLESKAVRIAGQPGHRIVFLGKGPDVELKYMSAWTMKDATAYLITYTALSSQYDRYLSAAQRMLRSFRLQ